MTWGKVDDRLYAHPKVLRAWHSYRASLGLWVLALSHSGAYLTDGHVGDAFVRGVLGGATERRRSVSALVDSGLWVPSSGGWEFHDFHDFNEYASDVLERRASRARAGGRGGARPGRPRPGAQAPASPTPYPFPERER